MQEAFLKAIKERDHEALKKILAKMPELALQARAPTEAARIANQKALVQLLRQGANLNGLYRGYRPLHALIQEKPHKDDRSATFLRMHCLRWLLANGADPDALGAFPPARAILIAAFTGQKPYVDELRAAGATINAYVLAALGDVTGVRAALEADPELAKGRDEGGLTALQCAAFSKMGREDGAVAASLLEVTRILVDAGADVNARTQGWSHELPVGYFAVHGGIRAIFQMLLERGMDPNDAIVPAVWEGLTDWTELAVEQGGDLNQAEDEGKPLLNQMIRWGQVKQTLWLLGKGADPNRTDERGWTAVHQAASRGNERMLRAVLEAGGDPKRKTKDGELPALLAPRKSIRQILSK